MIWWYVGILENFVDFGSCGGEVLNYFFWCNGLKWLNNKVCWFLDIVIKVLDELMVEVKVM